MEAFSNGVIASIITIMVLELRPPHTSELVGLYLLVPTSLSYMMSFIYLGIYWNNHHHLLKSRPTWARGLRHPQNYPVALSTTKLAAPHETN